MLKLSKTSDRAKTTNSKINRIISFVRENLDSPKMKELITIVAIKTIKITINTLENLFGFFSIPSLPYKNYTTTPIKNHL